MQSGIIYIPNDFIINLESGIGYKTTIKNIIVDYFNCGVDTVEQCTLELINVVSKGSIYVDSNYVYLIAKNCTDVSEFGGFYMGNGELYNCIANGFWPLVVQMYNCMGLNVYPDEGSTVENHIYDVPVFADVNNNNFKLVDGSTGIGSGITIAESSPDIYGNWRGNPPDRGAAEKNFLTPTAIEIVPKSVIMGVGYQGQYKAYLFFSNGQYEDVTALADWAVDQAQLATVVAGLVTALARGTVVVSATASGLTGLTNVYQKILRCDGYYDPPISGGKIVSCDGRVH